MALAVPTTAAVLKCHPAIRRRAAEYEVAEASLRLEVRRQYPDIQLGPALGMEDGQGRGGVGFSVPLPILNANRRGIAELGLE